MFMQPTEVKYEMFLDICAGQAELRQRMSAVPGSLFSLEPHFGQNSGGVKTSFGSFTQDLIFGMISPLL